VATRLDQRVIDQIDPLGVGSESELVISRRDIDVVGDLPESVPGFEPDAAWQNAGRDLAAVGKDGHSRKVRVGKAGPLVVHPRQNKLIGEAAAECRGPGEPGGVDGLGILAPG